MTRTQTSMARNLDELHARYYKPLLSVARRLCQGTRHIDPKDLVQETFLRFIARTEGPLQGPGEDPTMNWLITVMTRHFYDQLRKAASHQKAESDPTVTRWVHAQRDIPPTYERVSQECFEQAVAQLPRLQQITFRLRWQSLTNAEIAREMGISPLRVAKRAHDALKNLRKLLKPCAEGGVH